MGGQGSLEQGIKTTDAASYDAVAATFDQLSERFSADIAKRLIDVAKIAPGDRVLDLGTGAGLLALRCAQRASAGQVVGIDHSSGMLRQAEEKARRLGVASRTQFRAMDAEKLEFEAGSFDAAVSLFVLLHLPHPLVALKELHRVLKPGGRIVVGLGSGAPLLSAAGAVQAGRRLAEAIGRARGGVLEAPSFIQNLMTEIGLKSRDGEYMPHHHGGLHAGRLLAEAGFTSVNAFWSGGTFKLSPEEFWDVCSTYGSDERVQISALPAEAAARLREEFLHRSRAVVARNGSLIYRCGAKIYAAVRAA